MRYQNHTTKDTNPPAPTLPSKAATTTTPSTTGRGNVAAPLATTSGTPPPTTTSGVSTPVVIGGVIAAVIGIAGIIFAVMYYKRRRRNNDDGTEDFAPDAFKRQSVMLPDSPPPHGGGMMRQNNTEQYPASFANGRAHPFSSASYQDSPMSPQFSNGAYYGYEAQQGQASFNPGQVVPMAHPMAMNNSPPQHAYQNAANPFFSPVGESPMMSPVTPHTAPMNPAQAEQAALMRKSSATMATMATMNTGYVTRGHPSVGPHEYGRNEHEYVDLSRSSVTPFQAAQYAEISRRLNTAPPVPLPSPAIASAAAAGAPVPVMTTNTPPLDVGQNVAVGHLVARTEESLPESPFADPEHTRTSAADPDQQLQPPSPSHSPTTRINSIPPMLPEIHLPQRAFSPMGYPESNKQLAGARTGPSPLANVAVPSNAHLVDRHSAFADVPKTPNMDSPPITPRPHVTETKRPETLYDDDDAYAGI
ncbi:hypothetical protein BXZ70DRAFT_897565 [Cristinia sonorae]|uniref:Uncharacterized protein n=1 Tax=Cristinia sonorae TaxID=1940300 RepID=A0A8K0XMX3_9AGAR|nr:hypothetical protein BXZ70DRAFT_897565 [Cristinia sonorae]